MRGHVIDELAEQQAARRSGMDMTTWLAAHAGETIIGSGRYPHLSRITLVAETPLGDDRFERTFRLGLDHVLTGIAHSTPTNNHRKRSARR